MDKNSTILVTGAAGMLGKHLVAELQTSGYSKILTPPQAELDLLNLKQVEDYLSVKKPEYIFHLAGLVYGLGGNLDNQLNAIYINSQINLNLFYAVRTQKVKKIFFAGTVASYPFPYHHLPLTEDQIFMGEPHQGEYGYAVAKSLGYHFLYLLKTEVGIDYCVGLFTNMFGEYDHFNAAKAHVIPSLIFKLHESIKNGTPFEVWGSGVETRDFLYAKDAAKAAVLLMSSGSGIINISTGVETSIKQLVDLLVQVTNFKGKLVWNKNAPAGIPQRSVSNAKLQELKFGNFTSLKQGLKTTYEWFKANQE